MKSSTESDFDPAHVSSLVEKCVNLCADAESAAKTLEGENATFLANSLEDALQQLELVLRGIAHKDGGGSSADQGFLSRLFAREITEEEGKKVDAPALNLNAHGLQGNSWTISLAELLGFLAYGRKTGVLWVDTPEEDFLIGLVDGTLMHASSNHTPPGLRLGEVLVAFGFLTQRQLERYLSQHNEEESATSGEALLERGMISDDELQHALAYQVQQLVYRMVDTKNAVFRFREGMQIELAFQVSLNIDTLLLESARVLDESAHRSGPGAATLDELDAWEGDDEHARKSGTTGEQEAAAAEAAAEAAALFDDFDTEGVDDSSKKDEASQDSDDERDGEKGAKPAA